MCVGSIIYFKLSAHRSTKLIQSASENADAPYAPSETRKSFRASTNRAAFKSRSGSTVGPLREYEQQLTFLRCPVAVPMNTTVKSPVEVAATAVSLVLKISTGTAEIGISPPNGVFTSSPQKSSPIVCNFWKEISHTTLVDVSLCTDKKKRFFWVKGLYFILGKFIWRTEI